MFGFALEKILGISTGALLVVLVLFGIYHWTYTAALKHTISNQAEKIAELEHAKAALLKANSDLAEAANKQNAKVLAMQEAQDKASEAAKQAIAKANQSATQYQAKYQQLLKVPRTGNECNDTARLLDDYFKMRKQEVSP